MFLDFTVENYRSIKEPVTLSAVAQKSSSRQGKTTNKRQRIKPDAEIAPGYHIEGWDIDILPVLAIFGANASGKSNIIQSLDYLFFLMVFDNQDTFLQELIKQPNPDTFKLDSLSSSQPTKFELRTIFDGNIYTYYLALNKSYIVSERLTYTSVKTKRTRLLFDRYLDGYTSNKITWKIICKVGKDFTNSHTKLQEIIRHDSPFIRTLMSFEIESIAPLTRWIKLRWTGGVELGNEKSDRYYFNFFHRAPFFEETIEKVMKVLKKFDTGLSNIEIESIPETDDYKIYAIHKINDKNEVRWLFDEESLGTQRLFLLAYRIVIMIEVGGLLLIDELTANLHPNIVKHIIRMFQNPKTNPKNAQLIFTSHDNTLQRNNLLRRDQIWFTQKRPAYIAIR